MAKKLSCWVIVFRVFYYAVFFISLHSLFIVKFKKQYAGSPGVRKKAPSPSLLLFWVWCTHLCTSPKAIGKFNALLPVKPRLTYVLWTLWHWPQNGKNCHVVVSQGTLLTAIHHIFLAALPSEGLYLQYMGCPCGWCQGNKLPRGKLLI